jgi:hypothetical protein
MNTHPQQTINIKYVYIDHIVTEAVESNHFSSAFFLRERPQRREAATTKGTQRKREVTNKVDSLLLIQEASHQRSYNTA